MKGTSSFSKKAYATFMYNYFGTGLDMMNNVAKEYQRKSFHVFIFLLVLVFFLVLQACSSTAVKGTPVDQITAKEIEPSRAKALAKAKREKLTKMSQVTQNKVFKEIEGIPEYRIGPHDVLEINFRSGDRVETTTVKVDSRGRISYSFIDDLKVQGLTPTQVDDLLTEKLSNYIRNPRIDIQVQEYKSKTALVMGEFASLRGGRRDWGAASGKIYLKGKTTLIDLIAQAGGYTVDANIRNVRIIRDGKPYVINLYDIIEKGNENLNVIIDAGDVVDIPELPEYGERVYVMGAVNGQGIYPLEDAPDLLAAISLAGSITSLAKEENTLIVRPTEPGEKPRVMMADVKALLRKADTRQNISLEDGDLVYVPRMLIGDINDWIKNMKPLLDILLYPSEFESKYRVHGRHLFEP